jgi:hypothetical protein
LLLAKKKSVILETEGGVGISGRKKNNLMHQEFIVYKNTYEVSKINQFVICS